MKEREREDAAQISQILICSPHLERANWNSLLLIDQSRRLIFFKKNIKR